MGKTLKWPDTAIHHPVLAQVRYLPYVVMAYNFSPNRITGISPYEIVFGRPPPFPTPNPECGFLQPTVEGLSDHLLTLKVALQEIQAATQEKLEMRKEQIRRMFDKFRRPLNIKPGKYLCHPSNGIWPE